MFSSPFQNKPLVILHDTTDVVFVADFFIEDYVGGAELTSEALIKSCDMNIQKIHSKDLNMDLLALGARKHWIFTNFSSMNPNLIPSIMSNLSYSIVEYDYKFCVYRSIEKHEYETNEKCNCHEDLHGKMMSAFFHGAQTIWWMSEEQESRYFERFSFLREKQSTVLSSVFDDSFFVKIKELREKYANSERKGWIVLGSESWIKGAESAEQWCKENGKEYEVVWGLPYPDLLEKLAAAKGFVYLPRGGDTCPRMVIEAKLLGCELQLNEHVQHASEIWFKGATDVDTLSYLYASRDRFWTAIKATINYQPTLSGYTTVYNATSMGYPWKATVNSMLDFCQEVVVADGGSDDGTWETLQELAKQNENLKIYQRIIDRTSPSFAYESDGKLKAFARSHCTLEYCWQMDADEVLHEDGYKKVYDILRNFPKLVDVVSLPVVEYWGSDEKVRVDVNPWKWRLSRNCAEITQGIPGDLLCHDEEGNEYAKQGTDSCDYINAETGERLQHVSFYSQEVHDIRLAALSGDAASLKKYEQWFNNVTDMLPVVHHYSWINIPAKIKQYKKHWGVFWKSLYRIDTEDTADNNVMFNKPWSKVTDNDIEDLGNRLANEMGGWIFHEKVDFNRCIPHITLGSNHPKAYLNMGD